jgi:hypothetical protein
MESYIQSKEITLHKCRIGFKTLPAVTGHHLQTMKVATLTQMLRIGGLTDGININMDWRKFQSKILMLEFHWGRLHTAIDGF